MRCKALVIDEPGKAMVKVVELPAVGENDVRIKVKACGICGTDVHIFHGQYLGAYPVIPGHEFAGIVEEAGRKVTRIKVGDHVSVEPNIACDNCAACLGNRQNFCARWNGVGVTLPGGFAEYTVAPEKAVFNIGKLPFLAGAFVEPLSCVLHGIQRVGITMGDKVLVVGAGPIGILLSKAAQLQGASEITQVDKNEARLALAAKSGAAVTSASIDSLQKETYDVVIDATGSATLMAKAVDYVRKGGAILWFGVPRRDAELKLPAFTLFEKGLRMFTSYTSVRNSIQAVRLLESGAIDVAGLVSHQLPLAEYERGVELIDKGLENVLKVMIIPER